MNEFTTHACEQVLRFTRVHSWDDLSEERKVQLGFNMGAMSLALNLPKEDGYLKLQDVREGTLSMQEFRTHMQSVIAAHNVLIDEENIQKPF